MSAFNSGDRLFVDMRIDHSLVGHDRLELPDFGAQARAVGFRGLVDDDRFFGAFRFFRARRLFDHALRAPRFELRFLLSAGDLVMFDNCRLLHGRTGFDPAEGLRHLQGCYIDIDGPRSLYRVLRRRGVQAATVRRSA